MIVYVSKFDLKKPLVPFIMIRGYKFIMEYENLHSICFNYGKYGQRLDNSLEKIIPTITSKVARIHLGWPD